MPGRGYYDKTLINGLQGERWFCTEQEAIAAGLAKSEGLTSSGVSCANRKFFRSFVRWMMNLNAAPRYQVLVLCGGGACHANSG